MDALTLTQFRYAGRMGKGVQRTRQRIKRLEAEARNARTPHNRTKKHRLYCPGECTN